MGRYLKAIFEPVERSLDAITTYKLVLYFLQFLFVWATVMSAFGVLPYDWAGVALSGVLLTAVCWGSGWLLSHYLDIARNAESDYITAMILALILTPGSSLSDYGILAATGLLAVASKYLIVINRRHLLNPAAFGAFAAGLIFNYYPSWWIGTPVATPLILLGGLLILRKLRRFIMVGVFLAVYIVAFLIQANGSSGDIAEALRLSFSATPLLFFGLIMLTEPSTSPWSLNKVIPYAALVGVLYSVSDLKLAPEEALLIGNVFAYVVTRDKRLQLAFVKRRKEAEGIYSYLFSGKNRFKYKPGQFMEWTVPTNKTDSRGNRRYFTVSASPTEKNLMLTVRVPEKSSSFKQSLNKLKPGDKMLASRLSGDFVLPKDKSRKLAFIAGGVGITPFRSIIKYLVDSQQPRDIALLYSANSPDELAFMDLFNKAGVLGIKTAYNLTDLKERLPSWDGHTGPIRATMIKHIMPDYKERLFYVSGPYGLVQAVEQELKKLGIPGSQIKLDYFPGYG